MSCDIDDFLKNEREISEYNISLLQKREITPSRKRLIEIEKDFLSIPFQDMGFSNLNELSEAISLYRTSRKLFYSKYKINNDDKLISKISKKISFLDKIGSELTSRRVQELNLVQDNEFFENFINYFANKNKTSLLIEEKKFKKLSLKELQKIEPAILSKKRSKLQASLYSLGLYIFDFVDKKINSDDLFSDLFSLNSLIDSFVFDLDKFIYRYYNESLTILPQKLKGTMGENSYLNKAYFLDNILLSHTQAQAQIYNLKKQKIDLIRPTLGNICPTKNIICYSYQKDHDKKTKNKVFGILLPVERLSREKMTSLYQEIYIDGIDVTELFCDTISNVKVINENNKKIYYKCLLMKPFWELLNYAKQNNHYKNIISKLINESLDDLDKFNENNYIYYLNSKSIQFIEIDKNSQLLVPQTRAEEYAFEEIKSILSEKILEIKNDYKNIM